MKNVIGVGLMVISAPLFMAIQFGGVVIHLVTILRAYTVDGFGGALLALVLPFFAEIWWFFKSWNDYGMILNPYGIWIVSYFGAWAGAWVLLFTAGALLQNE